MTIKKLILGVASYVPGAGFFRATGTGGTCSAEYCYSVWLRHMVFAHKNGLNTRPEVVAELGPGDSLGIGLAALISGCERYFAFDVVEHASTEKNVLIFDDLVSLFKRRAPIPVSNEFPHIKPILDNYDFPSHIFDDERLQDALQDSRLNKIRESIDRTKEESSLVRYRVPWYDSGVLERETADMIYSQAVLEHVDDLENTYEAMRLWLKPGGYMSHQIDFKCHGTSSEWNGHWTYSDFVWKIIRGKRAYLINREPHSTHVRFLEKDGYDIVLDNKVKSKSVLSVNDLAARYKYFSEDDLTTSGVFIQAVKPK